MPSTDPGYSRSRHESPDNGPVPTEPDQCLRTRRFAHTNSNPPGGKAWSTLDNEELTCSIRADPHASHSSPEAVGRPRFRAASAGAAAPSARFGFTRGAERAWCGGRRFGFAGGVCGDAEAAFAFARVGAGGCGCGSQAVGDGGRVGVRFRARALARAGGRRGGLRPHSGGPGGVRAGGRTASADGAAPSPRFGLTRGAERAWCGGHRFAFAGEVCGGAEAAFAFERADGLHARRGSTAAKAFRARADGRRGGLRPLSGESGGVGTRAGGRHPPMARRQALVSVSRAELRGRGAAGGVSLSRVGFGVVRRQPSLSSAWSGGRTGRASARRAGSFAFARGREGRRAAWRTPPALGRTRWSPRGREDGSPTPRKPWCRRGVCARSGGRRPPMARRRALVSMSRAGPKGRAARGNGEGTRHKPTAPVETRRQRVAKPMTAPRRPSRALPRRRPANTRSWRRRRRCGDGDRRPIRRLRARRRRLPGVRPAPTAAAPHARRLEHLRSARSHDQGSCSRVRALAAAPVRACAR
ncbi:hypothetical protein HNR73_002598 [Phytomonospora endophytica]|uniref:Uncharacterized protein n=1 Tax=Phytomonospora endophytica TaxID=714109 RepID=A0A841FFW0_9ACTN|nr:hypothetical protein [Phytomonospora endophytica]